MTRIYFEKEGFKNFHRAYTEKKRLRKDFNMRLNPQIIMVRASMHDGRIEFTKNNPGKFNEINNLVMSRMDEPSTQLTYWLYKKGNKNRRRKKYSSLFFFFKNGISKEKDTIWIFCY